MLIRVLSLASILFWSIVTSATEQHQELDVTSLSENVFLLTGERVGANVGVVITNEKVLLIDTLVNKHSEKLIKTIEKLTKHPVTHIVNTHGDFDHTGVNEHYRQLGALVIAQKNVSHSKVDCDLCFEDYLSIKLSDDVQVAMKSAVSHSFSDNIVYIPTANIVFMGDILTNISHPTFYQGGIAGFNKAISYAVSLGDENTKYVAGHGFTINAKQLENYLAVTKEIADFVVLNHGLGGNSEEILKNPKFNNLYAKLENKVSIQDTSPNRLKRFIDRIVATEISSDPQVYLGDYAGTYQWDDNEAFQLVHIDNKLLYKELGQRIIELIPVNKSKFMVRGQIGRYYQFSFDDRGSIDSMTFVTSEKSRYVATPIVQ
ncbi:MBL fold metallo-hydrolase [Thalassotalea sp. G2M2-11]|uniref:MBL fold metallo-hydrolase n=1 Tax=Thalassotalea sp. G2M2-11 TaxID=2787627 RepID=UPI0019CFD77C|nr:MBL fold metallo-hydrolase [Thalassotalea sp. G2M2-11]